MPAKLIVSPTFHVSVPGGAVMVAVGSSLPALITTGVEMSLPPRWSVTFSRTL